MRCNYENQHWQFLRFIQDGTKQSFHSVFFSLQYYSELSLAKRPFLIFFADNRYNTESVVVVWHRHNILTKYDLQEDWNSHVFPSRFIAEMFVLILQPIWFMIDHHFILSLLFFNSGQCHLLSALGTMEVQNYQQKNKKISFGS